jgi:tRNA dimethylallyltransferase
VGYKEIFNYLDGKYSLEKAIELIKRNTRRFAKRQISWFSRDKEIVWFHPDKKIEILDFINKNC